MINMSMSMQGAEEEEEEEECNTGLGLGVGSGHDDDQYTTSSKKKRPPPPPVRLHMLFPPKEVDEAAAGKEKRKRAENSSMEIRDQEAEEQSTTGGTRKKLKLTKEQSTLLEDSFREHQTLNLTQKQELADRLKLTPRQVEVWFQNKRARNKLKQTEVDCERLLKWCESLRNENSRLKRELQELRNMSKPPAHVEAAAAAAGTISLTICPSHDQSSVTADDGHHGGRSA